MRTGGAGRGRAGEEGGACALSAPRPRRPAALPSLLPRLQQLRVPLGLGGAAGGRADAGLGSGRAGGTWRAAEEDEDTRAAAPRPPQSPCRRGRRVGPRGDGVAAATGVEPDLRLAALRP